MRGTLTLIGVIGLVSASPAETKLVVPRGAPIVVDGRLDSEEWRRAIDHPLGEAGSLRLQHDGRHLLLGISAVREGFASVCLAMGEEVRILHASAALGSVRYRRGPLAWLTESQAFTYAMRSTDLDEPARRERGEYLEREGWVASTYRMGNGRAHELQIVLDLASSRPRLAIAYFLTPGSGPAGIASWPAALPLEDGCRNEQLVRGSVPPELRFEPARWTELGLEELGPGKSAP